MAGMLRLPGGVMTRIIRRMEGDGDGWQVDDDFEGDPGRPDQAFRVCWQFPPGSRLQHVGERIYRVDWTGGGIKVGVDSAWQRVAMVDAMDAPIEHPVREAVPGLCSPGFRQVAWGPRLVLTAPGHNPCLFRTTFLASGTS
jgi:hypothetical protein